jgi:hypothetical protein
LWSSFMCFLICWPKNVGYCGYGPPGGIRNPTMMVKQRRVMKELDQGFSRLRWNLPAKMCPLKCRSIWHIVGFASLASMTGYPTISLSSRARQERFHWSDASTLAKL